jgi:hypothetical protein
MLHVYLLSRNNQHYVQICTTALFYILAPTCFDSSLPSSGSFWIHLSYMKIQIDLVVYNVMLVKRPVCRSVEVPSFAFPTEQDVRNHEYQYHMINHDIDLYFHVPQTDPEAP